MRITIKDIAERAGVSKTTVSFAFNEPGKISKETYERVMGIAGELGYVPDPVARTLTTKRIGAIGLLLPQPIPEALRNPYLHELMQGIGAACHEHDFALTVIPPVKGRIVEAARRAAVDAILTIGVGPDGSIVDLLQKRHVPFVTIDGKPTDATLNVGIDDRAAARTLMEFVLGLGHRRIAIIELQSETVNEPEERSSLVRDARMAGFRDALDRAGIDLERDVRMHLTECSIEGGRTAGHELLARDEPRPTVAVCMSDVVAFGFYAACRERGIRIPEDLSVTGFDDVPYSSLLSPPLTTVRQPGYLKGYEAARIVLERLAGGSPGHIVMETELVTRTSAAAPSGT